MSTTYSTVAGDTFEQIARKVYGDDRQAIRISNANPGTNEPLNVGVALVIPTFPDAPGTVQQSGAANDPDEIALLIDGQRFRFWEEIQVSRSIDSMDTVQFLAPMEADAPGFKETFRPFSFKPVEVTIGGEPLFTGTMMNPTPTIDSDSKSVSVDCYSLPGVLNDCPAPASAYPLEFFNQGLQEIAATMAGYFGLDVEFQADQGAIFDLVACGPTKKVLAFLAGLAKQRNLVISSTERGKLLFWQSVEPGNPVARLSQGESPLLSVTANFNPQQYYSHITGITPVLLGFSGDQYTVKNERLTGVIRPHTFNVPDSLDAEAKAATEAAAGRMFGNMAGYTANVSTLRDPQGDLWRPNTTIMITAPDAMIYSEYEFVIRSVGINRNPNGHGASLELALPGSFSGKIPEALPWDG